MAEVDQNLIDGTAVKAFKVAGTDSIEILAEIDITSGDSANSIYRIANLPANYIPVWGEINTAGITGLQDVDLGLYLDAENGGAVKDVDALVDGQDISSALAIGSGADALKSLGAANLGKTLAELVSDAKSEYQVYTLALTLNDDAGATGKVFLRLRLINGAN